MTQDELRTGLKGTITEFMMMLSSLSHEQLNALPFEGSWTAGQVGKHVMESLSKFSQMLAAPGVDTDRPEDQLSEKLRSIFLDFSHKMKSPAFIDPPSRIYEHEELVTPLGEAIKSIDQAFDNQELGKILPNFELPGLGTFTRLEALYFMLYHTQRHLQQLENILKKLMQHQADPV